MTRLEYAMAALVLFTLGGLPVLLVASLVWGNP